MTRRRPPTLALWLLERLGFARANAPLVGDLLEEFRNGRSAMWFWRQTLAAIATSLARRAAALQIYWIALTLGFVAQLPISLLLFHFHFPPAIQGPHGKIAAVLLIVFGYALICLVGRRIFGKTTEDLKLILLQPGAGVRQQRSVLVGAAAFESCTSLLLLYWFLCITLSPAIFSSPAEVAGSQFLWLALGELSSDLMLAFRQSRTAETAARKAEQDREWERVWSHLNELRVTLVCSNGDSILLERETCVETIFASANEEAIAALFKGGTSLEQIRRAVWLASAASHRDAKANRLWSFGQITVPKFARLLRVWTRCVA